MTKHRHGQGKAAHQQQASIGGHEQLENVQKLNKEDLSSSMKREPGSTPAEDTEIQQPQSFPGRAPAVSQKLGTQGARKKLR